MLPWHPVPHGEVLWLRVRLPQKAWLEPAVRIDSVSASFEAYVGPQRVWVWPTTGFNGPGPHNYPWQLFTLPADAPGKVLTLRVGTLAWPMGVRGVPVVGERADHLLWALHEDWSLWPAGWIMVMVAVLAAVALLRRQAWKLPAGFALASGAMGLAVLNRSHLNAVLLPGPLWFLTWVVSAPVLLVGLTLLLHELFGSQRPQLFKRLLRLNTGLLVVVLVQIPVMVGLQVSTETGLHRASALFSLVMGNLLSGALLINVLLIVWRLGALAWRGDRQAQILMAGMAGLGLSVADAIRAGVGLASADWHSKLHLGGLALVVALAFMLKRHYTHINQQVAQQTVALALQARERETMLRDLHDGVGGLTTNIRMLAELGQSSDARALKALQSIFELSGRTLTEIRAFVQSLDEGTIGWTGLAAEMRAMAAQLLEAQERTLQMHERVAPDLPPPSSMLSLNLLKIFREALTNACKYGHGEVAVTLDVQDSGVHIKVCNASRHDAGAAGVNTGRGLGNMRARANELGGEVLLLHGETVQLLVHVPLANGRAQVPP